MTALSVTYDTHVGDNRTVEDWELGSSPCFATVCMFRILCRGIQTLPGKGLCKSLSPSSVPHGLFEMLGLQLIALLRKVLGTSRDEA